MRYAILPVTAPDCCSIRYGVLDLTPQVVAKILARMDLVRDLRKTERMLSSFSYRDDAGLEYIKGFSLPPEDAEIDDGLSVVEAEDINAEESADRTDVERMIVDHESVYWTAVLRDAEYNSVIETHTIWRDELEEIAKDLAGGAA